MKSKESTQRFSDKVENYVKFRPHYPDEIITFLKENADLSQKSIIADIGSGTGISSELFLNNGNIVYAVEPNFEMRTAAEKILSDFKNFKSINGTAENTTLKNESFDMINSGQAFHWFDREKCKIEFQRILKKDGYLVLMWNTRVSKIGFMNDYEELLLKFGTDYVSVNHENINDKDIENFYFPSKCQKTIFPNFQEFDFEGIKGRLLSSSYIPVINTVEFNEMLKSLREIFEKNSDSGIVKMEYLTEMYFGNLK